MLLADSQPATAATSLPQAYSHDVFVADDDLSALHMRKASETDRPWAYHLAMEAIALAGLNRPKEALAGIEESVAENPQPIWGVTDQAQALNVTVALSILHELDSAFEWLEKTAHVFLNSYNPHLFDILDGISVLEPVRTDGRYEKQKREYSAKHDKTINVEMWRQNNDR